MATFTPVWTDSGTEVISARCMARNTIVRGTIDLRTAIGAYLFVGIGRGGTTVLTNGVVARVRRVPNNDGIHFAADFMSFTSTTAAAILKLVNNGSDYAPGTVAFTIDGTGTPAVGDTLCFWGVTAIPADTTALSTVEFLRCSKSSTTSVTTDTTCLQTHHDNDIITSKADTWSFWVPGGSVYEVIFDYGDDAAGESVAIVCYSQTYTHDASA